VYYIVIKPASMLAAAKCGNGPNMVISPLNVTLSHVNTTAKMREVLESVAGLEVPEALVEVGCNTYGGNHSGDMQHQA